MSALLERLAAEKENARLGTPVSVPEWDVTLQMASATAGDMMSLQKALGPKATETEYMVALMQRTAYLENGERAFGSSQVERVKMLKTLDADVMVRVLREAKAEPTPLEMQAERADHDGLRALLVGLGGLDAGDAEELSEPVLEAVRAILGAREHQVAEILGEIDPEGDDTLKNG